MNPTSPSKGHRLWILWIIAAIALIGFVVIQTLPDLERNFRAWITSALILLILALVTIWYLAFSRFSWRWRLGFALLLGAAFAGGKNLVRKEGSISGTGLPRLVWIWTPKPDGKVVTSLTPTITASITPTNLPTIPDVCQFFGPNRDGIVRGAKLSTNWDANPPKLLWRQPIGQGWSSFSVCGGHAFTQEQRGGDELVTCYDVLSGKLIWAHTNQTRFVEWQGGDGPRATPTLVDGYAYAFGATGILDCLNATNGALVWSHGVLTENKISNITWGTSSSPLVYDNKVVVSGGRSKGPALLAFERTTGKTLWQTGDEKASYTSATITTLAGKKVLLYLNAGALSAYDPETGAQLANFKWGDDRWPRASQPAVLEGDKVFLSAGYGVGCSMVQFKLGADGKLTATELWKNKVMKTQFNSVAFKDGFLYGMDDGLMACVDASTGQRKWKDGRFGSGQSLMVDDTLLVQSEPGPVYLVSAKPDGYIEYGKIAALSSKTWNHPVLAGKYLLVRNDQEAACFELPIEGSKALSMASDGGTK